MAAWRLANPDYQSQRYAANPTKGRAYSQIRRARLKGVISEEFEDLEIFCRDNWVCHLCQEPIDPTIKNPDPMSSSIDHFWPLSLGGPHIRANVFAAHLGCNCSKQDKMPEVVIRFLW